MGGGGKRTSGWEGGEEEWMGVLVWMLGDEEWWTTVERRGECVCSEEVAREVE